MRRIPFTLTLAAMLTACGQNEPARPDDADQRRFEDIDAMLDEERHSQIDVTPDDEKGAAPEDAAPSD